MLISRKYKSSYLNYNRKPEDNMNKVAYKILKQAAIEKASFDWESVRTAASEYLKNPDNWKNMAIGAGTGLGIYELSSLLPGAKKKRGARALLAFLAGTGATIAGDSIRSGAQKLWDATPWSEAGKDRALNAEADEALKRLWNATPVEERLDQQTRAYKAKIPYTNIEKEMNWFNNLTAGIQQPKTTNGQDISDKNKEDNRQQKEYEQPAATFADWKQKVHELKLLEGSKQRDARRSFETHFAFDELKNEDSKRGAAISRWLGLPAAGHPILNPR